MSSKNLKEIKSPDLTNKPQIASYNAKSFSTTLHNKVDLFNSKILESNIDKLKNSLNEKKIFLSKYEESKKQKVNDFIFDPNVNYDIERSKLEKVSNVKGINWSTYLNENLVKAKGLGIIKLKQSLRDLTKFNMMSNEKNKAKKKVNFKEGGEEEINRSHKQENLFVPKKLISDRHIFLLNPMGASEDVNESKLSSKRDRISQKPTLRKILESSKKDPVEPEKKDTTHLFISHFLQKVDSPSPRKKLKSSSLVTGTEEIKGSFKINNCSFNNFNINNNNNNNNNKHSDYYNNENSEGSIDNDPNGNCVPNKINGFELENKNTTNEKNLTNRSNMDNIKSKSFKCDGNLIAEEQASEKSDYDSEKDNENSFEKKESIMNKTPISNGVCISKDNAKDKTKTQERLKSNNLANLNYEEKLNSDDKNINQLYLNDFLTSSPTKSAIGDLSQKSLGLLSFTNVKNNILSSINLNNVDLNRKKDKNYVASRLSEHIFGVRDGKLLSNKLFQNENKSNLIYDNAGYNNTNNNESSLLNLEIRNNKTNELQNATNSKTGSNLISNLINENMENSAKSPMQLRQQIKNNHENDNSLITSSPLNSNNSPIPRKFTIRSVQNKLPILNKMQLNRENAASPPRMKHSFNLLTYKHPKNNIIPTLLNKEELFSISKNLRNLKSSSSLLEHNIFRDNVKDKNPNSFHNKLLNKFNLNKSSDLSRGSSCSSDGSDSASNSQSPASSLQKFANSERNSNTGIKTYSNSDAEEIKKEEKDKFKVNLIDNKILEQLKVLKKITIESPKKTANKRKYTIYDKNVLKFFNKEIRNEKHDKDVEKLYGKIFELNLEKILELRSYPARVENQTKSNKNIERRKFAEKNFVNKYICDMKEKIHFMKGLLDFSYSKIICDKVRFIGDNVKKQHLKKKLKKIRKLNENEMQEVIQDLNELKYLDVGELVTDSENEQQEEQEEEKITEKRRGSCLKNSITSNSVKPKKYKTVDKIFSQLKQKLEKLDTKLKESLKEVNNKSIQSYLNEAKTIANRGHSVNSVQSSPKINKKQITQNIKGNQIKFANLFESLPNFNNTLYKQSCNSETPQPPLIPIPKPQTKNLSFKEKSNITKLPLIGAGPNKSRASESVRKSFDFTDNNQTSCMGKNFTSPIKANNLSGSNNDISNCRTTSTYNPKNANMKKKHCKNYSQIDYKNIKSHYAENFKNKYDIFKEIKKDNNVSYDSAAPNKNTIIGKIGDFKKTIRDFPNKYYLSTENFNEISPRKANFDQHEANDVN